MRANRERRLAIAAGLLLALGAAGLWWKYRQVQSEDIGADYRYAVHDLHSIGRVEMLYRDPAEEIVLSRVGDHWMVNGLYTARQNAVDNLLDAIRRMELSFIPRSKGAATIVRDLAAMGNRIRIYHSSGELLMAYYIGGTTPDERGTFIIKEGTAKPAVVSLRGWEGSLRPRFIMPEVQWRDRTLLAAPLDAIVKIEVDYPNQMAHSFQLSRDEAHYLLYLADTERPTKVAYAAAQAYLRGFAQVGAEDLLIDSVLRAELLETKPFAHIKLTLSDDTTQEIRLYPIRIESPVTINETIERYYVLDGAGDLYLTQERVVGKTLVMPEFFLDHSTVEHPRGQ